jgi:nicotinate-nucleotide adenylyltransferase
LIIPAGDPWQKTDREVSSGEQRLEMCRLAVEGVDGIEVDRREVDRDGPTYTVETLATFPPDEELFVIVGSDSLAGLETWHRWKEVVVRATLVEAPRSGTEPGMGRQHGAIPLEMGLLEISSSDIRRRATSGLPYRFLVTEPVFDYIEATNLYLQPV